MVCQIINNGYVSEKKMPTKRAELVDLYELMKHHLENDDDITSDDEVENTGNHGAEADGEGTNANESKESMAFGSRYTPLPPLPPLESALVPANEKGSQEEAEKSNQPMRNQPKRRLPMRKQPKKKHPNTNHRSMKQRSITQLPV